jgi:hypothetical protein
VDTYDDLPEAVRLLIVVGPAVLNVLIHWAVSAAAARRRARPAASRA